MGKGMLFLVLSTSFVLTQMKSGEIETEIAIEQVRTEYEENVLAREIAHSALNLVIAKTTQDFTGFRSDESGRIYRDGAYSFSAVGEAQGPITITAFGQVGSAVHQIQTTLARTGSPLLDATTFDGPVSSITANGSSFVISGLDSPANESDTEGGNGLDGHAIRTILPATAAAFSEEIDASQMVGINGAGDIVTGKADLDLDLLQESVLSHPDLVTLEGDQRITGNKMYGSPDNPILMHVNGDLTVRGSVSGHGVLIVSGSLSDAGSIHWKGLVILAHQGGDHEFKGNSEIFGALVIRSLTEDGETGGYDDAGLVGGQIDVDVFDSVGDLTYHEHQYDDKFDTAGIEILSADCEIDGGLCWDRNVVSTGLEEVRIVVENTEGVGGTYSFQTMSTFITGAISSGFTSEVNLVDVISLNMAFSSSCDLLGLSPGDVWADGAVRAGGLTVKIFDMTPEESGGEATILHEVVVYRHSDASSCSEIDSEEVEVQPISFYINGSVGIHKSYSALSSVIDLLPAIETTPPEITMGTVKQNSARMSNL